jgi:fructose-1,6-bisphosphatase I
MHPAHSIWPSGKLHLLYECAPLAFLIEQAGGIAVSGYNPVLDCIPASIHERCPVVMGSPHEVGMYLESCGVSIDAQMRQ